VERGIPEGEKMSEILIAIEEASRKARKHRQPYALCIVDNQISVASYQVAVDGRLKILEVVQPVTK
jgi:hypothetical protein